MYDPFTLTTIYTGLMVLAGIVVYVLLYLLFKRAFGKRFEHTEPEKDEVVMCGEKPPSSDFIVPVSRVFVDVFVRSLRRGIKVLRETLGSPILHDWFFYMLVVLIALILISIFVGVSK